MNRFFGRMSRWTSRIAGTPQAFWFSVAMILLWAITGPFFHWSDTWQLLANTGTTLVTFLMVFLLQSTQNRESRAMQMKLDELIWANERTRKDLLNAEELDGDEFDLLKRRGD